MLRWDFGGGSGGSGVVLACALALGACGEQREPNVGQARQALAAEVSEPFEVERFPNLIPEFPSDAKLACGSLRCMAFYRQNLSGYDSLYASRITHEGALVDLPRLRLDGNASLVVDVAARGDDFLVFWYEFTGSTLI